LAEHKKLARSQQYVRGLFSGGTLCYESETILQPLFGEVFSNAPIKPENKILGDAPSKKHVCIDMGAEEFVEGRAHPMIDFSLRNLRILQEAKDPETAVILIDVELGYGSNEDPAGQLVPVIQKAKSLAKEAGRYLPVVASVVGTEGDFQGLEGQEKALSDAGVLVMPSNAQATQVSALIASGEKIEAAIFGRSN
jgi:FdrA protein